MRRLRVLFVAGLDPMPGGGAGGQLAAARALHDSGIQEHVEFVKLSSTMESVPPPPLPVRVAGGVRRLGRFLRAVRGTDAVLVFASDGLSVIEKGLFCVLARWMGKAVVLRISSGRLPAQVEASVLFRGWLRLVLWHTGIVCAQGPFWVEYFQRFPEARGKVMEIRNGIPLGARVERMSPAEPRVVFVGWMQRAKGIFEALEAMRLVTARHRAASITFAGGGGDLDALRAAATEAGLEGRVHVTGWLDARGVRELLESAAVFVLPSHYEGLPNALLEAMAAGLPAVATRVGAIPDVVRDGETGFLIDVGDTAALAARIAELLDDPLRARAMGARGRAVVEELHDIERVWRRYLEALQLAARRSGPTLEVRELPG